MERFERPRSLVPAEVVYAASVRAIDPVLDIDRETRGVSAFRQSVIERLQEFVAQCRGAGIDDGDTAEARYALVAFIDDRILHSSWPGKSEWTGNPLQVRFFREYAAGENFFVRMRALVERDEPSPALEVYSLCLALGFEGAASSTKRDNVRARDLDEIHRALRLGPRDRIAPNAIPIERAVPSVRRKPFASVAMLTSVAFVALVLLGFHFVLESAIRSVTADLSALSSGEVSAAGGDGSPVSMKAKAALPVNAAP